LVRKTISGDCIWKTFFDFVETIKAQSDFDFAKDDILKLLESENETLSDKGKDMKRKIKILKNHSDLQLFNQI
jgi:hypothetical protein